MTFDFQFFERVEEAVGPILPGFIAAVLFIAGGLALRIRYRGQSIAQRIRRPLTLFYVYIFLFAIAVISQLYWPGAYRIAYFLSLLVLALGVVLSFSIGLFDIFLLRYRKVVLPAIIRDIAVLIVYILVVVTILGQEGVEVTSLVTTSAVFTAIIGFALQDLLSNIISGLSIQVENPFRVGEWVRFEDLEGEVLEINWRSTKIKTLNQEVVIIANNVATRTPIVNFSVPTRMHRRQIVIGLRYEAPPNRVHESLLKAARSIDGVLQDPPPFVLTTSYDDFSIAYRILFFINDFARREVIEGQVYTRLWYQLSRDGFSIPFPIRDINLHTVQQDAKALARDSENRRVASMLGSVAVLKPLSDSECQHLAKRISTEFYARGETIIRQGDLGASMYIIAEGEVQVRVGGIADSTSHTVNSLGPNEFFGERSLLTGEARQATVVALHDCVLHVIDKEAFREIIVRDKELVDAISRQLVKRDHQMEDILQKAVSSAPPRVDAEHESLVKRIRGFFQLR